MPESYLPADHAAVVGGARSRPRATAADAGYSSEAPFAFGSVSSFQKMDSTIFDAWANLLRRTPGAALRLTEYAFHDVAIPRLKAELAARGVSPNRLEAAPRRPWADHHWAKGQLDIALDTSAKSGHTVVHDALWAGVPVVSFAGGRMEARAGATALRASRLSGETEAVSLRDYEDLAFHLARRRSRLDALRKALAKRVRAAPLFDGDRWAADFAAALDAAYEAFASSAGPRPHIVPRDRARPMQTIPLDDAAKPPPGALLLHVGGSQRRDGWRLINGEAGPFVDHVLDVHRLTPFGDSSAAAIYAADVLQKCAWGNLTDSETVDEALAEWLRVLKPGGALMLSVPDVKAVSTLLASDDEIDIPARAALTALFVGGQTSPRDVHRAAFDFGLLNATLEARGFCDVRRTSSFGLFNDSSLLAFRGEALSLNVAARACGKPGAPIRVEIPGVDVEPPAEAAA